MTERQEGVTQEGKCETRGKVREERVKKKTVLSLTCSCLELRNQENETRDPTCTAAVPQPTRSLIPLLVSVSLRPNTHTISLVLMSITQSNSAADAFTAS